MSLVQFIKKGWRGLALLGAWTALCFVVMPRLPIWAQVAISTIALCYISYLHGKASERKLRIVEAEEHARVMCEALDLLERFQALGRKHKHDETVSPESSHGPN